MENEMIQEVDGNTVPTPINAPDHVPEVVREVAGELVIPEAPNEARTFALSRLRKVLGKTDAKFATVAEARQGLSLVWADMEAAAGTFSQQRMAQLIEIFQTNEQAIIKQSLSREGVTVGTNDYSRLTDLNSIFNCYQLVGTDALESSAFDAKGLPQGWAETKKSITAHLKDGRANMKKSLLVVVNEMKVKAAMKLPASATLSPEAAVKAREMADAEINAGAQQEALKREAKKTTQGIAATIAGNILRQCKVTVAGVEKIDDAKATAILGAIQTEYTSASNAFNLAAATAEKKASEAVKH